MASEAEQAALRGTGGSLALADVARGGTGDPRNPRTPAAATPESGPQACRVEFELRYAFASRPLEMVVSPVFDRIANTFVDAFVARAEQVHGRR